MALLLFAAIFISRARSLKDIIKTIKLTVLPVGALETVIGLIGLWSNQPFANEDTLAYISKTNISYYVASIPVLYALIIFIIATVWLLALENREK